MGGEFRLDFARYGSIGMPGKLGLMKDRPNIDRDAVLNRLKDPAANIPSGRAADFIRLGQFPEANAILLPLTRSRNPDFATLANFAHLNACEKNWAEAIKWHESALEDAEFPAELAGTTPPQRAWLKRVEKDYYRRWLKLKLEESRNPVPPGEEKVFPLFAGEPPSDAVAIVQQLLLWFPGDARLYWLLAELYAKSHRPHQAAIIFKSLSTSDLGGPSWGYGNRTVMMEHYAAVQKEADATPLAEPELAGPPPDSRPWYEQMGLAWWQLVAGVSTFAALAVLLLFLQFRKLVRGSRKPQF